MGVITRFKFKSHLKMGGEKFTGTPGRNIVLGIMGLYTGLKGQFVDNLGEKMVGGFIQKNPREENPFF